MHFVGGMGGMCRRVLQEALKSAFNATCFIGWRGDPTFAFVARWEKEFWKYLLAGDVSAQEASSLARTDAIGLEEGEPEATHVCEGDVAVICNCIQ